MKPRLCLAVTLLLTLSHVARATVSDLACASYTLDRFGLPCPPPTLNAAPAGTRKVRLFWNAIGGDGYSLQAAPAVSSASFTNLGVTPVLLNGTYHAPNNTANPQQFFRLRKP